MSKEIKFLITVTILWVSVYWWISQKIALAGYAGHELLGAIIVGIILSSVTLFVVLVIVGYVFSKIYKDD